MFGSVGWGEILVLLLVALFVFGPDRLPGVVKDAGGMLRKIRGTLTGARRQIRDELGDSFPDLDPRMLNPKQFVRRTLLEDLDDFDEPPLGRTTRTPRANVNTKPVTSTNPAPAPAPSAAAPAAPAAPAASAEHAPPPLAAPAPTGSTGSTGSTPPAPTAAPAPAQPAAAPAVPYDPDTT